LKPVAQSRVLLCILPRSGSAAAAMTPDTLKRVPNETAIIDRVQRSGAALSFDANYRPGLWVLGIPPMFGLC